MTTLPPKIAQKYAAEIEQVHDSILRQAIPRDDTLERQMIELFRKRKLTDAEWAEESKDYAEFARAFFAR